MPQSFRYPCRIEFRDTDAAGIAHFSVYFTLMEQAEHAMFRDLGLRVMMEDNEGHFSWPRVAAKCDYSAPLRFDDDLAILVSIERLGGRSVTYAFEFLLDSQGVGKGQSVAKGQITTVCCRLADGAPPKSMPIPESVKELLRPYVAE